jgi:hypothetical protein
MKIYLIIIDLCGLAILGPRLARAVAPALALLRGAEPLRELHRAHWASSFSGGVVDPVVAIGDVIHKQAFIMAHSDTFFLMGISLTIAPFASLMLQRPKSISVGGAH